MTDEKEKSGDKRGFEWIKSDKTGVSYLCPVGSIQDKKNATDEDLKKVCVDESMNPQND
jgi:hypothetical protein